jgi:hypothetical protein
MGNGDARDHQVIDRFDITQSPSYLNIYESDWTAYYAGVYRCNELIDREEQINWNDTNSKRGLYMGECRAIRAILYFDMVRLWGNIPLLLSVTDENLPQSPASDVYDAIFSDLRYAIENIPADAYPKKNADSNDGHVTKYAAEALLARAYLYYTGYYDSEPSGVTKAEALAAVEDIINSGEYKLVPEFKNLWPAAVANAVSKEDPSDLYGTFAGEGNSETVFSLKFTSTSDWEGRSDGNRWQVFLGFRNMYAAPYSAGWGALTVLPSFVDEYGTGDTRKEASIIDVEGEGLTRSASYNSMLTDQREYTGYFTKKYFPLAYIENVPAGKTDGSGDMQLCNQQDYVIVRYADVLLMAAELGSSKAQTYFDQVRKRAYTIDAAGTLSPSYTQVAVSQSAIQQERKLEFAFEGINYWDLLRQGVDVAAQKIAISGVSVLSGGVAETVTIDANRIKETKGLSQIPNNQITLSNGVLKQNAGW